MQQNTFIKGFSEKDRLLWGRQPMRLAHGLHESTLFSRSALASLVENYPREHYSLVNMGGQSEARLWREGEFGGLSGREIIEAIAHGRMWLNLRNVSRVDARYGALLDEMFAELSELVPDLNPRTWQSGILISSPSAQVYYHADLPGQLLWQIVGKKRVYIYPSAEPFIGPRDLEDIALFDVEVDLPYQPWYDDYARVLDLEPGQLLTWPLNAPHRVENVAGINISMTVSYTTETTRRADIMHLANGILRHRFGIAPKSTSLAGPGFLAKRALQKLYRNSDWVKRERAERRAVQFKLDRAAPDHTLNLLAGE
jgi:hypothetical protein